MSRKVKGLPRDRTSHSELAGPPPHTGATHAVSLDKKPTPPAAPKAVNYRKTTRYRDVVFPIGAFDAGEFTLHSIVPKPLDMYEHWPFTEKLAAQGLTRYAMHADTDAEAVGIARSWFLDELVEAAMNGDFER